MNQPAAYPAPYASNAPYGPGPQQPYGSAPQPPYAPVPQPPRRSSAGKIIGIIAGVIVILAGLGTAALFLFGTKTLDEDKVQSEIVRVTQQVAGVAPTDVHCPTSIPVKAGEVTTCTAQLDGQPVSFQVRQDDDQGNLHIDSTGFVAVDKIEKTLAERIAQKSGVDSVTADCAGGKQIVVGGKGTTISCTVTNTADPSDTLQVTGTVTDDKGTVDFG